MSTFSSPMVGASYGGNREPKNICPCLPALGINDDDAQKCRQIVVQIKTGFRHPITMPVLAAMIVGREDHPLHGGADDINAAILQGNCGKFRAAAGIEVTRLQRSNDAGGGQ